MALEAMPRHVDCVVGIIGQEPPALLVLDAAFTQPFGKVLQKVFIEYV